MISNLIIPSMVLFIIIYGFRKNTNIYEDFLIGVKEGLDGLGYDNYVMSEVTFVPDNYMSLDEETTEKAMGLIEALEDIDDVQAVYHNLEM